jgi:DNA-binding NarL/FixJ family response regulator
MSASKNPWPREQVLRGIARGLLSREIGEASGMGTNHVCVVAHRLMRELGVTSRRDLPGAAEYASWQ